MTPTVSYQELVDEILQEYPERKGKEEELRQIFDAIARIKPNEEADEAFKEHLKQKLVLLFKQHMMTQENKPALASRRKYAFAGAGTMGIVLIVLSFLQPGLFMQRQDVAQEDRAVVRTGEFAENTDEKQRLSFATSIRQVGAEEFGTLQIVPGGMGGMGGGGGDVGMMASQPELAPTDTAQEDSAVSDDSAGDEKMMIMPYPEGPMIRYVYTYEGTLPDIPSSMAVYQIENTQQSLSWSENRFSTDMIDLDAFDSLEAQNLTFVEDKQNGFMVYVDLMNGTISMYRNYEYAEEWVEPTRENTQYATGEVLSAAQEFVDEYAIDLSQYGEATIYQPYYYPMAYAEGASSDDALSLSVPYMSTVEVKYPYLLEDTKVYEQYGQIYGVSVNYDLIKDQVQGLYGIANHALLASSYAVISDEDEIRTHLRNGGFADPQYGAETDIEEVEVPVGSVELVYAHVYEYSTSGQPTRYFVPALKFTPQRDAIDAQTMERALQMGYGYPSQNDIIVPLVESLYEN